MFRTRVITAIVAIPALLSALYYGGIVWEALFSLLAVVSLYEFYNMMVKKKLKPISIIGFVVLFCSLFYHKYPGYIINGVVIIMLLVMLYAIVRFPGVNIRDISVSLFGAFYIGFFFNFAIRINELSQAFFIILLAFLLTWGSDTGGYLVGNWLGKHKLAPQLSPNKTWEGSMGGVILTILVAIVFFRLTNICQIKLEHIILIGIVSSILAQIGDLFMSSLKRYFRVKDTGKIIPGHGGVLDRFDSFILVVPFIYCFFTCGFS